MKLGIVGAGAVGSACAMALVNRGVAREIVLVDRDQRSAAAVAKDIRYGAALLAEVDIRAGTPADLAGADLVIISAGVNEKGSFATVRSDPPGGFLLLDVNA